MTALQAWKEHIKTCAPCKRADTDDDQIMCLEGRKLYLHKLLSPNEEVSNGQNH